jgi:hypothetical protein
MRDQEDAILIQNSFKECALCKIRWATRSKFIYDPEIRLIGYQINVKDIENGLLLFNHLLCKNTLALEVRHLADMYDGPLYKENKYDSKECPSYCLNQNSFEPCPLECSCAYIREIMQIIRDIDFKKHTGVDESPGTSLRAV